MIQLSGYFLTIYWRLALSWFTGFLRRLVFSLSTLPFFYRLYQSSRTTPLSYLVSQLNTVIFNPCFATDTCNYDAMNPEMEIDNDNNILNAYSRLGP
jgi:hypothetical protein